MTIAANETDIFCKYRSLRRCEMMDTNMNLKEQSGQSTETTLSCNGTCDKQIQNIASELTSAFMLFLTVFIGISFNLASIYRLFKQNWRKYFTLIQLQSVALVYCGLLAPVQITRIGLSFTDFNYIDLCHFHHFSHLHAEACAFLSMIIIAFEKCMKIFTKSNDVLDLTLRKGILTFSWTLILPFVTYIIHVDHKDPTSISAFSKDCTEYVDIHTQNGHLIESINMYVFTGTFLVLSALYSLCILKLLRKKKSQSRRVDQDPSITPSNTAVSFISSSSMFDTRNMIGQSVEDCRHTHAAKHRIPSVEILDTSTNKIIPSVEVVDISVNNLQKDAKMNKMNIHKVQVLRAADVSIEQSVNKRTRPDVLLQANSLEYPKQQDSDSSQTEQMHIVNLSDDSGQGKVKSRSSTPNKDSPNSGVTSNSSKFNSTSSKVTSSSSNKNSLLSWENAPDQRKLSFVSEATGSSSVKESLCSEKTGDSSTKGSAITLVNSCHIEMKNQLPTSQNRKCQSNMEDRKTSETSFSQSEEKNSITSTRSVISDTEDCISLLNPLRHTRTSPGNVFHHELKGQQNLDGSNQTKSSPLKISRSIKKKKKKHKNKVLKKQPSTDSIGAFSMSSQQSDISTLGESDISSSYKFQARSIDSFLDEGLANILEQPEPEHQDNCSLLDPGTNVQQSYSLEIPEMRLRSNTGNLQSKNTLQVEDDEFRQRAQSDLTEDKQKKLLEAKKLQSLKNRKLTSKFLKSNISILSGASTDSSMSDFTIEKDPITREKLITYNQLDDSNESLECTSVKYKKCPLTHFDQLSQKSMSNKRKTDRGNSILVNSTTQTEDDIFQMDQNIHERSNSIHNKGDYPTIRIIRPSVPDTVISQLSPRCLKDCPMNNIPAIREDMEDNNYQQSQFKQTSSYIRSPGSQHSTQTFIFGSEQRLENYNLQEVLKCVVIITVSFMLFYLPMFIVVHILGIVPNKTGLHLLLVARSIQYIYYCILPKIYVYAEERM